MEIIYFYGTHGTTTWITVIKVSFIITGKLEYPEMFVLRAQILLDAKPLSLSEVPQQVQTMGNITAMLDYIGMQQSLYLSDSDKNTMWLPRSI